MRTTGGTEPRPVVPGPHPLPLVTRCGPHACAVTGVAAAVHRGHLAGCRPGTAPLAVRAASPSGRPAGWRTPCHQRAGRPASQGVGSAAYDQPRADAAGDLDVREVPDPATAAPDHLAERAQIGVVVHVDGHAEP